MYKSFSGIIIAVVILLLFFSGVSYAGNLYEKVCGQIGERIMEAGDSSKTLCGEGLPCRSKLLLKFYSERGLCPAWSDDTGPFPYIIEDFVEVIRSAYREGLRPEDYHLQKIEATLSDLHECQIKGETFNEAKIADLDLMLTDAFLLYASHLLYGRVDHREAYPGWVVNQRSADMTAILYTALESGDVERVFADLAPKYSGYTRLKEKLIAYQAIAERGGWPKIPEGSKLRKGSHHKRVAILRQRLLISGDLHSAAERKPEIFDRDLEVAVKKFQKRHGLKEDGRVGKSTLNALNVPVHVRIHQMALNMDRMRWLSNDIGKRYIFVNIADFLLEVIEDEQVAMGMRIIAGKDEQRSCVLSGKMTYLELNPFWRIPDSIATREILPHVKKDPGYLEQKNIKVFPDWGDKAKQINAQKVNWSRVRAGNLTYKFRQEPGPANPLGRVKFMFPNECEIYLHDTPARHLFGRERRDFSHGCIRIEKPIELATYLLGSNSSMGFNQGKETWTRKKIVTEINKGKRQVVMLPEPISVYIFYGTAWVDRGGELQFRNDIYHIDEVPYELPAGGYRDYTIAK